MGLEVHVELNTNTKMFCGCPATFGGEPNTQTCPTCLGLPGSLPVVNARAVDFAVQIGLAELFPNEENPFPWMSEMIDLKKERNFFETRVIEYQSGGALSWD